MQILSAKRLKTIFNNPNPPIMVISKEVFDLNSFHEGMRVSDILRKSSLAQFQKLRKFNLIRINSANQAFLTDKGMIAKKIGVEKYIELEEFEKELSSTDPKEFQNRKILLIIIMITIFFVMIGMILNKNALFGIFF